MEPITIDQLRRMPPVVDILTAARALDMSRTKAYDLAKKDQFPCPVLRVGTSYRVPLAGLLKLLHIDASPDS